MKKLMTSSIVLIALLLMSFNTTENVREISAKSIVGTWTYVVPNAPYEYQNGELTFQKEKKIFTGFVMVSGYKNELNDVTVNKNKVSFYVYFQGEKVTFNLDFTKKSFKGMASYSGGDLEISGEKKKK